MGNAVFKALSKELSEAEGGNPNLFAVSERVEGVLSREKKMYPNADFYAASAYHQAGIPTDLFTPIFVVARTAGWLAHVDEQRAANRIIRPMSRYSGEPPRDVPPLDN